MLLQALSRWRPTQDSNGRVYSEIDFSEESERRFAICADQGERRVAKRAGVLPCTGPPIRCEAIRSNRLFPPPLDKVWKLNESISWD